MLAAMLRQSTAGGSGGGGSSSGGGGSGGGGGTKLPAGISRLSSSSVGSAGPASMGHWGPGRVSKSGSVSSDSSDIPASDPNYIMQLVSDVRKFADVLLQLKEVFNSKGIFFFSRAVSQNTHCFCHFLQCSSTFSSISSAVFTLMDSNTNLSSVCSISFKVSLEVYNLLSQQLAIVDVGFSLRHTSACVHILATTCRLASCDDTNTSLR